MDLTHVIDTSGAYIPGHGTPTVILFGRDRAPVGDTVRTVMGIKGEPSTPNDAAKGLVWSAIVSQVDRVGSESEWVSSTDTERNVFARHPWSVGGGGAADLNEGIESVATARLKQLVEAIGRTTVVGEDDVWITDSRSSQRWGFNAHTVPFVIGEALRDWSADDLPEVIYPYNALDGEAIEGTSRLVTRWLWNWRTLLVNRTVFGKTFSDRGEPWYIHLEHYRDKLRTPLSIPFAFVATHNHFVLDRGGKVFKQSAPVIKLPAGATEDDHLALIGLLNSSTACFWMKQVFHNKGSTVDTKGARQTTDAFENFYEFTGTGLKQFPVTEEKPLDLARELDRLAQELAACAPAALLVDEKIEHAGTKSTEDGSE